LLDQPTLYAKDREMDGFVVLAFGGQRATKLDEPPLLKKCIDETVYMIVDNRILRDVIIFEITLSQSLVEENGIITARNRQAQITPLATI